MMAQGDEDGSGGRGEEERVRGEAMMEAGFSPICPHDMLHSL